MKKISAADKKMILSMFDKMIEHQAKCADCGEPKFIGDPCYDCGCLVDFIEYGNDEDEMCDCGMCEECVELDYCEDCHGIYNASGKCPHAEFGY